MTKKTLWWTAALAAAVVLLAPPRGEAANVGEVAICHSSEAGSTILEIGAPALGAHLAHGDYVTTLVVGQALEVGDGVHFESISAALDAARQGRLARGELLSAACRITVAVPAGNIYGSAFAPAAGGLEHFPLVVDVPDITLRGALVMEIDGSGRATGLGAGDAETTLTPIEPLPVLGGSSTPLIVVNAHPGGAAGNGCTVEGFVFQSGHDPDVDLGGQGVLALRATGLVIRANRFEGGFTESVDLRAASGEVVQNHLSGRTGACDICLAGPGNYRAEGNRLLDGGIEGIVVAGVIVLPVPSGIEQLVLPLEAETWGEILNNEVRNHGRPPAGGALRVDALGVGASHVPNKVHAVIRDNLLVNNRFALVVHAAFPATGTASKGDVDVTMGGNVFEETCQARLLVSLARHTTALGLNAGPSLRNSTFELDLGGDVNWDAVWYSHPPGFGNTLIVDGETIANGSRHFYNAFGCPSY